MSFDAVTWANHQKAGSALRKLILIQLASCACEQRWSCFPSQAYLAKRAECSKKTVARALVELETAGLIRREPRRLDNGHRTSDLYFLTPQQGDNLSPCGEQEDSVSTPNGLSGGRVGTESPTNKSNNKSPNKSDISKNGLFGDDQPEPSAPKKKPKPKDTRTRETIEKQFEAFWKRYPARLLDSGNLTKGSKEAARKKWFKYGYDDQKAAFEYVERFKQLKPDGSQFVPDASKYLNQRMWEDDVSDGLPPPVPGAPQGYVPPPNADQIP